MRRSQKLVAGVLAWYAFIGCGGVPTTPTPPATVLFSGTLSLPAGGNCNTSGVSADFSGTAGKAITVNAQGLGAVNPAIVLYAPDFATQLSTTAGSGGRAALNFTLTQNGRHHITVCDQTGTGGSVVVTVTQAP